MAVSSSKKVDFIYLDPMDIPKIKLIKKILIIHLKDKLEKKKYLKKVKKLTQSH